MFREGQIETFRFQGLSMRLVPHLEILTQNVFVDTLRSVEVEPWSAFRALVSPAFAQIRKLHPECVL